MLERWMSLNTLVRKVGASNKGVTIYIPQGSPTGPKGIRVVWTMVVWVWNLDDLRGNGEQVRSDFPWDLLLSLFHMLGRQTRHIL